MTATHATRRASAIESQAEAEVWQERRVVRRPSAGGRGGQPGQDTRGSARESPRGPGVALRGAGRYITASVGKAVAQVAQKGSHVKFAKTEGGVTRTAVEPHHREVAPGTLRSILSRRESTLLNSTRCEARRLASQRPLRA